MYQYNGSSQFPCVLDRSVSLTNGYSIYSVGKYRKYIYTAGSHIEYLSGNVLKFTPKFYLGLKIEGARINGKRVIKVSTLKKRYF